MPPSNSYRPDPRILSLGEGFYDVVDAASFPKRILRFRNQRWAARVGLGELDAAEWEAHFGRFNPLARNLEKPLALRYHGHQFGVYNQALGDERGFLFAQLRDAGAGPDDPERGRLLDLGTKGSGRTPYARGSDGRLTLKGGVREVLATEMLEALGVYTSKSFSLFETGEALHRTDEPSPTRSSVLVRLGHSHLRFGSFQRHHHLGHRDRLDALLQHAVEHYVPEAAAAKGAPLPCAFLRAVARKHAALCASYMVAGFVHGVLNTDNMNITGESFDYGPYRFLPTYDPKFVAAYFDASGLYAFGRQPRTFAWNLSRLAEALRPLSTDVDPSPVLREFERAFVEALRARFLTRLGLRSNGPNEDDSLIDACFMFLLESGVGYDRFFFDWVGGMASTDRAMSGPAKHRYRGPRFDALRARLSRYQPSRKDLVAEPYFQQDAPCTLLIDEIEAIWRDIEVSDDWSAFNAKIEAIRRVGTLFSVHLPPPPSSEPASSSEPRGSLTAAP